MSNTLKAKIEVTAPGVQETFDKVSNATTKAAANLNKVGPAASKAKFQMVDLARVVQDLPFGFTAISNNLTQLIPGVGLAGLAFSGLVAALTFSQVGLSAWSRHSKETSKDAQDQAKAVDEAKTKQEEFGAAVNDAAKQLVSQARDFKELRVEIANVTQEYVNLTDAIVKKGVAAALFDQKNEATQKLLAQAIQRTIDVQKGSVAFAPTFKVEPLKNGVKQGVQALDDFTIRAQRVDPLLKKAFSNISVVEGIQGDISDINKLARLLNVTFDDLFKDKKIKEAKFEFDALKAIFIDLVALQKIFNKQIEDEVKIRAKIRVDFASGAGSAFTDFSKQIPAVSAELQKEVDRLTKNNVILKLGAQFTLDMSAADARIRKDLEALNGIFKDTVDSVFGDIGTTLGDAISGGDVLKGIQGLFSTIASGIASIGKQFIKIGTLALLANSAIKKLFSNPALSIAVGVALVAAAAALKNSLGGGLQGRAGGGRVNKGQPYIVGEIGREIFVPDTGGTIVPNNKIAAAGAPIAASGNSAMRIVGELILRGNDLVAALANANRAQGRLT